MTNLFREIKDRWLKGNLMTDTRPWIAMILLPVLVNFALWVLIVVPQQQALRAWKETKAVLELKPKLETLVAESHQMLTDWKQIGNFQTDTASATQAIQQLANRHRIQVKKIPVREKTGLLKQNPGFTTVPFELEATGHFNKLARWLSDLEKQAGFRVDSWKLTPAQEPKQPHQLTLKMTVLLGGGS